MYKSIYILSLVVSICTSFDVDPPNRNSKFMLVELRGEETIPSKPIQNLVPIQNQFRLTPRAPGLPLHS